jgi:hypothetical protein
VTPDSISESLASQDEAERCAMADVEVSVTFKDNDGGDVTLRIKHHESTFPPATKLFIKRDNKEQLEWFLEDVTIDECNTEGERALRADLLKVTFAMQRSKCGRIKMIFVGPHGKNGLSTADSDKTQISIHLKSAAAGDEKEIGKRLEGELRREDLDKLNQFAKDGGFDEASCADK